MRKFQWRIGSQRLDVMGYSINQTKLQLISSPTQFSRANSGGQVKVHLTGWSCPASRHHGHQEQVHIFIILICSFLNKHRINQTLLYQSVVDVARKALNLLLMLHPWSFFCVTHWCQHGLSWPRIFIPEGANLPFPMTLSCCHMLATGLLLHLLRCARPSLGSIEPAGWLWKNLMKMEDLRVTPAFQETSMEKDLQMIWGQSWDNLCTGTYLGTILNLDQTVEKRGVS